MLGYQNVSGQSPFVLRYPVVEKAPLQALRR